MPACGVRRGQVHAACRARGTGGPRAGAPCRHRQTPPGRPAATGDAAKGPPGHRSTTRGNLWGRKTGDSHVIFVSKSFFFYTG